MQALGGSCSSVRFGKLPVRGLNLSGLKQVQDAGFLDSSSYGGLLRAGFQLRTGMSEVEVRDEFRHDRSAGVIGVAVGVSDRDAVVPGEVLT